MTPNEGYQRRLGEWEKKERERKEAYPEKPYDPTDMRAPVPLGCVLLVVLAVMGIAYFIYRLIALKIL